jgi:hypothetical protein
MRNLLALFGALVLTFVGVGWYLGWYDFRTKDGRATIDVNAAKAAEDVKRGAAAVNEKVEKTREEKAQ